MILNDFNELDIKEKEIAVFDKGEFVAVREYYNQRLCLYSMKGFFVEVYYSPDLNSITKIETVTDDKILSLYLNEIELKNYFK